MPRRARIKCGGIPHHIIQRGNNRSACFFTEEDYRFYLESFSEGAGHVPLVPIGFFLCGAGRVMSVDLHRRIDWGLTRDSLQWIAAHRSEVWALYQGLVSEKVFNERFAILVGLAHEPERFFKEAAIDYLAPMNAADTDLPDHCVDCHFSVTTLEHIPPKDLRDIFVEARRILTRGG
jgi:hypothetical protein